MSRSCAVRGSAARPVSSLWGRRRMPRGKGQRCSGFLSSDGRYAYCTREEHAGRADRQDTDPPTYRHILEGDCRCGSVHNPAHRQPMTNGRPVIKETYDYREPYGKLLFQVVRLQAERLLPAPA